MKLKRTLSIIKPDAIQAKFKGKILDFLEDKGFNILAQKKIKLTKSQAEAFYEIHRDKPFFNASKKLKYSFKETGILTFFKSKKKSKNILILSS